MSAVSSYWPQSGRLESLCSFPNRPDLRKRGLRDGVGRLYMEGYRRQEIVLTGEYTTNVSELLAAALERFGAPSAIGTDRWREAELREALKKASIPRARLELRGQGYKDGGADVRAFRRACADGSVTPIPSLILVSAMSEARTVTDPAGNSKLAKNSEGGRRLRARDDAAAGAIIAVALGRRLPKKKRGGLYVGMAR